MLGTAVGWAVFITGCLALSAHWGDKHVPIYREWQDSWSRPWQLPLLNSSYCCMVWEKFVIGNSCYHNGFCLYCLRLNVLPSVLVQPSSSFSPWSISSSYSFHLPHPTSLCFHLHSLIWWVKERQKQHLTGRWSYSTKIQRGGSSSPHSTSMEVA